MLWSWILAAIGVTGLYLTTKKLAVGFAVGVGVQILWIAYAIATGQWGFIASAIAYGSVNALGFYRWTKREKTEEVDPLDPHGDGTLRPGDPLFDAAMRGESVYGVRGPDGEWDLEFTKVDEES